MQFLTLKELLFLAVVFLTNIVQCITGFAGTVLAMPFSIMLVGYNVAKPILNILGLLASVWVVIFAFKKINLKELVKIVLIMIAGMLAGFYLKTYVENNASLLYKTLGIIVIIFAVMNAVKFYRKKEDKELPAAVSALLLVISGIVHGMFVCGGPLLVTYANAKLKDKDEFRGTLSACWILLNGIIAFTDIRGGYFTPPTVKLTLISVAVLAAALIAGNLIYKKMSRNVFLQLTYLLMLISGISLIIK
ncbi:MAG: sulfite exporter TauE/SafE family protein [Clostridia bacterium]|nr:sulfite exporter TauE/SafE family protein [Clostridia bacterium]MBR5772412.1 sulfite exporter TauE/SafE family protein [Clostridia bacterium]